jgi:ATP-dependent Clp protease protease subunit
MKIVAHDHDSDEQELGSWFNQRLLDTRTILLTGHVDNTLMYRVTQSLLLLEAADANKPIDLVVNSGGGSVTSGFGIFDMIRFIKPKVRTISAGMTGSIAAVIFCAPTDPQDRVALPNAQLLIHQPLIPFDMYGPASDLEITAGEILKTRTRYNDVIATASGKPYDEVDADTQRDKWLTPEEALEYGLVGRIVTSRRDL